MPRTIRKGFGEGEGTIPWIDYTTARVKHYYFYCALVTRACRPSLQCSCCSASNSKASRNRQLRPLLAQMLGLKNDISAGRVSSKLRRLRLHGLIERAEGAPWILTSLQRVARR